MSRIGSLLATLAVVATAFAQPVTSVETMPPLDRTKEDFYGAIVGAGPRVQVEWLLAPTTVERGGDVVLTLVVSNAVNPTELRRPELAGFRELFEVVENVPGADAEPGAKRVEFRYKLRPRNEGTFDLPLPKYRFYVPQLPEGRRFQLANAPAITLTVTKPAPKASQADPLLIPRPFFNMPTYDNVPPKPPHWAWYALAVGVPFLGAAYVVSHWLRNPRGARLVQSRRVKAVRRALNALDRAGEAGAVEEVFRRYLVERIGVPPTATTSREISTELARLVPLPEAQYAERILADCERERFDATATRQTSLKGAAAAWILKRESEAL